MLVIESHKFIVLGLLVISSVYISIFLKQEQLTRPQWCMYIWNINVFSFISSGWRRKQYQAKAD